MKLILHFLVVLKVLFLLNLNGFSVDKVNGYGQIAENRSAKRLAREMTSIWDNLAASKDQMKEDRSKLTFYGFFLMIII
jgi:hypothetical protein